MHNLGMDLEKTPLFYICSNEGTQEIKLESLKKALYGIDKENTVIISDAYVSTIEFPEEKYQTIDNIPVDKILKRESELLETLGFININFYVQYEYKVAFIYGNELGKQIINYLKEISEK